MGDVQAPPGRSSKRTPGAAAGAESTTKRSKPSRSWWRIYRKRPGSSSPSADVIRNRRWADYMKAEFGPGRCGDEKSRSDPSARPWQACRFSRSGSRVTAVSPAGPHLQGRQGPSSAASTPGGADGLIPSTTLVKLPELPQSCHRLAQRGETPWRAEFSAGRPRQRPGPATAAQRRGLVLSSQGVSPRGAVRRQRSRSY